MTLEQSTDHTGTTSNCLVACPLCDTELENGRLYQNLDMLVEDGWVSKGKKDQRTNAYATTTAAPRERPQGVAVVDGDLRARAARQLPRLLEEDEQQETLDNEPMECEACGHTGYDLYHYSQRGVQIP